MDAQPEVLSSVLLPLILGIVEGVTEYIPVSSTGHMILVGSFLGFEGEKAATFEIFIQLGAILAVVVLYWRRFFALLSFGSREAFSGVDGLLKLGFACAPAAVLGFLVHKQLKAHLFAPRPVAAALIFGGLVMLLIDRAGRPSRVERVESLTLRDALLVGIFQCASLWPGISRSGSMIVGGLLLGFERRLAAEFSFLVAVPIMMLATSYDLWKSRELLSAGDLPMFSIGFVTAFVTAALAIKFFMALLERFTLRPFGAYRIVVGLLVLVLLGQS